MNSTTTFQPPSLQDLTSFTTQSTLLGLVYGAQLGLSSLTLLLFFTTGKKRTSPIYILNLLALILDLARGITMTIWSLSAYNTPYVYFSGNLSGIPRGAMVNTVLAEVAKSLELGVVLGSLSVQVHVILSPATTPRIFRLLVQIATTAVAFVALAAQLATAAVNARNTLASEASTDGYWYDLQWRLADTTAILQLASSGVFLTLFIGKLGVAIWRRRMLLKQGGKALGPMQIVFIGSLQSMLIPVILMSVQWNALIDLGSLAMTALAIQLPLTALWASTSVDGQQQQAPLRVQSQRPVMALGSDESFKKKKKGLGKDMDLSTGSSLSSDDDTLVSGSAGGGESLPSPYVLAEIPIAASVWSLHVDVKMYETDMV